MDIRDFKAGIYIPQFQYKSFLPEKVNKEWIVSDPVVNKMLEEANLKLVPTPIARKREHR